MCVDVHYHCLAHCRDTGIITGVNVDNWECQHTELSGSNVVGLEDITV